MADGAPKRNRYVSTFRHKVDEKRRVQVPSEWRAKDQKEAEFTLILWPHNDRPDSCLMVMPPDVAEDFIAKLNALPYGGPEGEAIRADMAANAAVVTPDSVGRIAIPEWMAERIGVTSSSNAVLSGMWDRFQIWHPERYDETRAAVKAVASSAFRKLI
ncbi:MAG TPA: hypothetical protein DCM86_05735 [Verrucomicrobiales bacterium]|nr:hypothetical protein [Verrucomicrobiales bacterium]